MASFTPYFEKQRKLTARADHPNSVSTEAAKYPCFKLVHNYDWNDYGYSTWFTMWCVPKKGERVLIGDMKIMNKAGDAYSMIRDSFDTLGDDFCSVGMDTSFYMRMKKLLGSSRSNMVLRALRDCATNLQIYESFNSFPAFIDSLGRDIATKKAIKEARFLLEGRNMTEAYSFDYSFTPIYNKEVTAVWNVNLEYGCPSYKRTYSVIGENGVGKTQLMAKMVKDLLCSEVRNMNRVPMISSVMMICSSEFDAYKEINTDNARIPAVVCDVVQSDNTSDKLENAINTIITRGTYYADGEMLLMSDRYKAVLHSQLGACADDVIMVEEMNDADSDVVERKMFPNKPRLEKLVKELSTGQLQIFSLITYVCANIHLNSLIVIDEPEVHLHPRLVTNFIKALNELLERFDSYAIIATHSPLVVRECVRKNVYIMVRSKDNVPIIGTVAFDTFGEDLSLLYQNIFGCDERDSYFYNVVKEQADKLCRSSYEEVMRNFEKADVNLPFNGRMVVRDYFDSREEEL